jgi:hypothetical protein
MSCFCSNFKEPKGNLNRTFAAKYTQFYWLFIRVRSATHVLRSHNIFGADVAAGRRSHVWRGRRQSGTELPMVHEKSGLRSKDYFFSQPEVAVDQSKFVHRDFFNGTLLHCAIISPLHCHFERMHSKSCVFLLRFLAFWCSRFRR